MTIDGLKLTVKQLPSIVPLCAAVSGQVVHLSLGRFLSAGISDVHCLQESLKLCILLYTFSLLRADPYKLEIHKFGPEEILTVRQDIRSSSELPQIEHGRGYAEENPKVLTHLCTFRDTILINLPAHLQGFCQ